MSKPLTVKELYKACEKILLQHGDKYVFLIDDDEGNGCHACRYSIATEIEYDDYKDDCRRNGCDPKDCVLLG